MKLGSVTKLDKKSKTTSKKGDVIVIFPTYDQFGAIHKPHSGRIVCKTYIVINCPLILQKLKTELKNLWHYSFE